MVLRHQLQPAASTHHRLHLARVKVLTQPVYHVGRRGLHCRLVLLQFRFGVREAVKRQTRKGA